MCFYINKRFNLNKWDVIYIIDNIYILRIHTGGQHNKELMIYNVYNFFLILYTSIDSPSLLPTLHQLFEGVIQHIIVLKDFNVYYYI